MEGSGKPLDIRWSPAGQEPARRSGGRLVLRGRIDEQVSLVPLADQIGECVEIDLEGVGFINSMGVREWIAFLRALKARGTRVALDRCSEVMVMQMNLVLDAAMNVTVRSFHAPYQCGRCDHEAAVCLVVAEHGEALRELVPPGPVPCPRCAGEMMYDGIPQRDLIFLSTRPVA